MNEKLVKCPMGGCDRVYIIFTAVFVVSSGLSALADFGVVVLVFLSLMSYLDLQETIEVRVSRYGWKCSKRDYKIASAFLIISLFLIPVGYCLLTSRIAVAHPLIFFLSLALLLIPALVGILFALNCYMGFGSSLGYFYRKIHRQKQHKELNIPHNKF